MALTIRPATRDDAQALARLGRELNEHQRQPLGHFTQAAVLRDGFGGEPCFEAVLAQDDGTAVGYALYYDAYETTYAARGLYLCDIHVSEAARRRGVGRALLAAVAREARRRGHSFVWWNSKPWNADAQAFYRRLGATQEPVMAHALFGDAFERLAAAGAEDTTEGGPR